MDIEELTVRLIPFCQHHYVDESVVVEDVFSMPGHAGFAYGFTASSKGSKDKWYIRLPPPNVKLEGTADVMRQVAALEAMPETIPHCSVKWAGTDPQWFGRPYFIVPQLIGDVVKLDGSGWVTDLAPQARTEMARQACDALAHIHKVPHSKAGYLGSAMDFETDVTRWDRFVGKAADPEQLDLQPSVREKLLKQIPQDAPIGIFHGDFQWSNLFYSNKGQLLAVIDWELVGVGAILNDIGWFATFNDPSAWHNASNRGLYMPQADELIEMYLQSYGEDLSDINWYRALAAYKFSIITGFNLMLHRRGKRHDPMWEETRKSMRPLLTRASELLG